MPLLKVQFFSIIIIVIELDMRDTAIFELFSKWFINKKGKLNFSAFNLLTD